MNVGQVLTRAGLATPARVLGGALVLAVVVLAWPRPFGGATGYTIVAGHSMEPTLRQGRPRRDAARRHAADRRRHRVPRRRAARPRGTRRAPRGRARRAQAAHPRRQP